MKTDSRKEAMRKDKSQTGSAHAVIIVVLIIALIGGLGFVFWNSFLKKETPVSQTGDTLQVEDFCSSGENVKAENGTFCSKEIGVKFTVPSIFVNKLVKTDNYEVFEGPLDPNAKKSVGTSENVYRATISGNDNFTFSIAQEPLRTGYVDVGHKLQGTYYDQATGDLTLVGTPTSHYNSTTNTSTTGSYSKGEVVPSFSADGVRFYKGSTGDAGRIKNAYFGIINNKIVKISLEHVGYVGNPANDPSTIDADKVFDELDKSIKALKINVTP